MKVSFRFYIFNAKQHAIFMDSLGGNDCVGSILTERFLNLKLNYIYFSRHLPLLMAPLKFGMVSVVIVFQRMSKPMMAMKSVL